MNFMIGNLFKNCLLCTRTYCWLLIHFIALLFLNVFGFLRTTILLNVHEKQKLQHFFFFHFWVFKIFLQFKPIYGNYFESFSHNIGGERQAPCFVESLTICLLNEKHTIMLLISLTVFYLIYYFYSSFFLNSRLLFKRKYCMLIMSLVLINYVFIQNLEEMFLMFF